MIIYRCKILDLFSGVHNHYKCLPGVLGPTLPGDPPPPRMGVEGCKEVNAS